MAEAPEPGAVLANAIRFDDHGLVPAVVQQIDTGQVLMLGWMNRAAVARTLATGAMSSRRYRGVFIRRR